MLVYDVTSPCRFDLTVGCFHYLSNAKGGRYWRVSLLDYLKRLFHLAIDKASAIGGHAALRTRD